MARVVYSVRARRSLQEIALFIAERDRDAAKRLVQDIRRRLDEVLSVFPEAGTNAEGGRRSFVVRRHSVIYRYDAERDEVVVIEVFGPGMDWR